MLLYFAYFSVGVSMFRTARSVLLVICASATVFGQEADVKTIKKGIETLRQLTAEKRGAATRARRG